MKEPTRYRTVEEVGRVKIVTHDGFEGYVVRWTGSCSGCFETEDGHPVGSYPWDNKAKCYVGAGCEECGYTGKRRNVVWIPIDINAWDKHTNPDAFRVPESEAG